MPHSEPEQVKIPYFFSLEKDNKISYLLGTCHVLPLATLPQVCRDIIQLCKSFVTEQSDDWKAIDEFYILAKRDKTTPSWLDALSPEIVQFFETAITNFSHHVKADELEIWAAHYHVSQGTMRMLGKKNSHDTSIGMDHELINLLFPGQPYGLETLLDLIPQFKKEANSIQDLLVLYKECHKLLNQENTMNEEDVPTIIPYYMKGSYFFDPIATQESNDKDDELIPRNIHCIPNIVEHHTQLESPTLFAVGILHLIGEQGLLSLLKKEGFKIGRLTPVGTFESYRYPFAIDSVLATSLSQERAIPSCAHPIHLGRPEFFTLISQLISFVPGQQLLEELYDAAKEAQLLTKILWQRNPNNETFFPIAVRLTRGVTPDDMIQFSMKYLISKPQYCATVVATCQKLLNIPMKIRKPDPLKSLAKRSDIRETAVSMLHQFHAVSHTKKNPPLVLDCNRQQRTIKHVR
jgi:uncharacterized protein YbaP (TraB family)